MKKIFKVMLSAMVGISMVACSEKPLDGQEDIVPGPDTDNPAPEPEPDPEPVDYGWLEKPAASTQDALIGTYYAEMHSTHERVRNYTYNYDKKWFASMWVAYPLFKEMIGGSRSGDWAPAPGIPENDQINIWSKSYGVNVAGTIYSRGHQIPDADRSGESTFQSQTYYAINSTPQIQNDFNGGIWMHLENAIREVIPSSDTLYVVTGPTFKTVGGNEEVKMIKPKTDDKMCPVPNYYWKVLLKVKRSEGWITDACAVGFWFEHRRYPGEKEVAPYACPVDEIEARTGFDFYPNLPDELEKKAESNGSWGTFKSF